MLTGIQTKITEAFDIFDHESNKTVDVREIGTIVRSLGCCPSEAELHDILAEVNKYSYVKVLTYYFFVDIVQFSMFALPPPPPPPPPDVFSRCCMSGICICKSTLRDPTFD